MSRTERCRFSSAFQLRCCWEEQYMQRERETELEYEAEKCRVGG